MSSDYSYMWEYTIDPAHEDEFLAAYSPRGAWVKLFRKHAGYVDTQLHRDRDNLHRFVTIDRWASREAWEAFRRAATEEFDALDAQCESYTRGEREFGTFQPIE
jgi:quinol monooxygenase YgiN